MSVREFFKEYSRSPVAIGVTVIVALVGMAWLVNTRLRGVDMPQGDLGGAFGTPGQLSGLTDDGGAATAPGEKLPFLAPNMPPFSGITSWLNSPALTPETLKGKVVLVDFWTYSCINCIRTLPYVTAWYNTYKDQGFVVVGVHTPEFAFEKDETNVRRALLQYGITYPVAMDNDYGTWNNYSNQYWPAHYLFDSQGRLREKHFGEGEYDKTEAAIRSLLAEAGEAPTMPMADVQNAPTVSFDQVGTLETYVGYARQEGLGSPEPVKHDEPQTYSVPSSLTRNEFYLFGTWNVGEERATLLNAPGGIVYRYTASNANLVMGGGGNTVEAEVTLDGAAVPAALRGSDLTERDGKTYVEVSGERLYDLIDARGKYGTHDLKIEFRGTGVQAYAFTFG